METAIKLEFTQGTYGQVSVDNAGTAKISDDFLLYTGKNDSCGKTDTFEYTLTDANGTSSTATVTLKVTCTDGTSASSDNGTAMNTVTMILMMLLTGIVGLAYIRREEEVK